jgi:hypothetical protein
MKKLLIVLLALTVVGIFAVAEDAASVSVGAWGRGWFAPVANNGTDSYVFSGPGWGNYGNRVGVFFAGNSENMGFYWNPGIDGTKINSVCDEAKIWAAPSKMFKIEIGKIHGDVLRGKYDDFGDILSVSGKDDIFARFDITQGMLIDITPVEGAYIGIGLDTTGADRLQKDAFNAIQIAGGYTIANVGLARVQYIGNADTEAKGAIQAAFNYTGAAEAGLGLDVGVRYPLNADAQTSVGIGVGYAKDALSANLKSVVSFMGDTDIFKFTTRDALQVQYTVAAPYAVGVEVALNGMSAWNTDLTDLAPATFPGDAKTVDVYPYVKAGYSNGYLKVGFDYKAGLDDQDAEYALPIQLEYWF